MTFGQPAYKSIKKPEPGPDWVTQLVRRSSQYAKAAGSISGQGTYKKQTDVSGTTNPCFSFSLPLSLPLPPQPSFLSLSLSLSLSNK